MKKSFVISMLIIIVIFILSLFSHDSKNVILEKTNKPINNNKTFAIMLETEQGSNVYEESLLSSFPSDMLFNADLSGCENGGELIWNNQNMTVTIKSDLSERCYIYFSYPPEIELTLANNDFTWNTLEDAVSYNVYVDDELVTNISEPPIELYKFVRTPGTHRVKVGALGVLDDEVISEEYSLYTISQVSPTTKYSPLDVGDTFCPDYSEFTLPDFDYINVLNFNAITSHYQAEAASYCADICGDNQNCDCNDWYDWFFDNNTGFYYTDVHSDFCALNSEMCDTYSNITSTPFNVSVFNSYFGSHSYAGFNTYTVLNNTDTITINPSEHRLYYTGWSYMDDSLFIQFGKYGYVPSEWVRFSPSWVCVDENSIVYIYDEKKKRFKKKKIKKVKYNDKLLVWDFDNGCFAIANPLWIKQKETTYQYNLLRFSDGSTLKTINHHRIFNVEKGRFTYPMTNDTPIGTTTFNSKGEYVKLISAEVVYKKINYCNIITNYHMNLFTNDILTACRLNNIYEIKDMKFIKDNRKLKTIKDFKGIDKKWFDGLRLSEYDGNINKDGSYRKDIKDYIDRIEKIERKH